MYYLRTRHAAEAIKFTVDQEKLKAKDDKGMTEKSPMKMGGPTIAQEDDIEIDGPVCRMEEGCLVCGS